MSEFKPQQLTWAALLGRWVEFARSAIALPDDAEGKAWKQIVPDVIGLQAVTMALRDADQLDAAERALAVDRARLLIDRHTRQIHAAFGTTELHEQLVELITDAWSAVKAVERMEPDSGTAAGSPGGASDAEAS